MSMKWALIAGLAAALAANAARAEVTDRSAAGFEVVEKATIAASQSKVWDALMRPSRWWSSQHSWSGDAKNLTIVYADGKSQLRMAGALGPLQFTGATGHLGIALKPAGAGTDVVMSYDVGGYAKGGLAETFAAPVDKVLGEQLLRLKKYLETGKAD